jgi:hypothetical protein
MADGKSGYHPKNAFPVFECVYGAERNHEQNMIISFGIGNVFEAKAKEEVELIHIANFNLKIEKRTIFADESVDNFTKGYQY